MRGSKIRDVEGQGWTRRMVRRDLRGMRKVFGEADACCTAGTAAPAVGCEKWMGGREREREDVTTQYQSNTITAQQQRQQGSGAYMGAMDPSDLSQHDFGAPG